MIHVLREKDRKVYVVAIDVDYSDPIVRRRWYPTGIPASVARSNVGEFDGIEVKSVDSGLYMLPPASHTYSGKGPMVELTRRGATEADLIDGIEVPVPKTRRKGEIFWRYGEWRISGKKGEEILSRIDLLPYARM